MRNELFSAASGAITANEPSDFGGVAVRIEWNSKYVSVLQTNRSWPNSPGYYLCKLVLRLTCIIRLEIDSVCSTCPFQGMSMTRDAYSLSFIGTCVALAFGFLFNYMQILYKLLLQIDANDKKKMKSNSMRSLLLRVKILCIYRFGNFSLMFGFPSAGGADSGGIQGISSAASSG